MTGNNTPVFFIRDPIKFPDFIHTQKKDPRTNLKNPSPGWDFWSLTPESTHQLTTLFSDRGTPDGYRHINGYSSHTFRWINKSGEAFWVKLHFKTLSGIKNLSAKQANDLMTDPDYAQRDLVNHLDSGKTAEWQLSIQAIPERDYFAETEQAAFSPGHLVPGMEPSLDKMLQGRLFSYPDTHRHRLGANYDLIPINCPYRAKIANTQRDGPMRVDKNGGKNNLFQVILPTTSPIPWGQTRPTFSASTNRQDMNPTE
jgi:catalase